MLNRDDDSCVEWHHVDAAVDGIRFATVRSRVRIGNQTTGTGRVHLFSKRSLRTPDLSGKLGGRFLGFLASDQGVL